MRLKQIQEKWTPVFRPDLRLSKGPEQVRDCSNRERALAAATFLLASIVLPPFAVGPALAQAAPDPALSLQLNAAEPSDKGCRLTFVVTNKLGGDLTRAAFELALFNKDGVVDRLTVLDFRDMPQGKTKVSRFDLSGADCDNISRVLINQVTECQGNGIEASSCMLNLRPETKTSIVFGL
jgi:hypothetical protein